MPNLMMIQPGAFGDIITCAPIAKKYHDAGYDVYWPVREMFVELLSRLDYVKPILLDERELDDDWLRSDVIKCVQLFENGQFKYALNLADRGPHSTAELPSELPEQTKYRLANVDFSEKHTLSWSRDVEKENLLYSELVDSDDEYILAALASSDSLTKLPSDIKYKVVLMDRKDGYTIFDWYKLIKNAKVIYAVESSFHCFIDGIVNEVKCLKYRLPRIPYEWKGTDFWTVSEHWIDMK